ncbi:MAG TPA: GNAT family N-acetyltransferase [Bryobacteraceae bacterium]|jgi:predicted N-acetyltransferase YhbS|nr:GNAT family N-acetyltransferase [Bryobacteraceae bacterium]
MRVRAAEDADAEAITRIINDAFRAVSFYKIGDRIDVDEVRRRLGKGAFFLAVDEGVAAGCVYVELRKERAYLGLLSVSPGYQRLGLGDVLMTRGEDYCREAGCRFIDIDIISLRPELVPYYRRRGYVETGTAPYPVPEKSTVPCYFVTMSKTLNAPRDLL